MPDRKRKAESPDDQTRWRKVAEEWENLATMVDKYQPVDGEKVSSD
ncbi:MAG TPA: hypothetical protein VGJ01_21490 [Pseudolabrys sp.]|jgi:hypothetical protein